jgi:hypothetical protein
MKSCIFCAIYCEKKKLKHPPLYPTLIRTSTPFRRSCYTRSCDYNGTGSPNQPNHNYWRWVGYATSNKYSNKQKFLVILIQNHLLSRLHNFIFKIFSLKVVCL